jgi:ABC-type antimicrobial peptide transport system permease subunit
MVKNSARERELSIRAALGASSRKLTRELLAETLLLTMGGGLAGLLAGVAGLRLLVPILPVGFPRGEIGVAAPSSLI